MDNKKIIFFSFISVFLVLIFAIVVADILYQPNLKSKRGFQIEFSKDGKPLPRKIEPPVDIEALLKIANVENGAKVFKKCATCHNINKGEGNKVGPNLYGIVGRARASGAGFAYSDAMKNKGGSWNKNDLNLFLTKPKDFVPGTKMGFAGLKKPQDRADIILFLEKNK